MLGQETGTAKKGTGTRNEVGRRRTVWKIERRVEDTQISQADYRRAASS
jgi:hypothetical protein